MGGFSSLAAALANVSHRPAHRPFRGLLSVHSRCGLHTRTVTKVVTVIRRLQTFRLLHACSGCFRLERLPGGACTRWKCAAFSPRTGLADLGAGSACGRSECPQCVPTIRQRSAYPGPDFITGLVEAPEGVCDGAGFECGHARAFRPGAPHHAGNGDLANIDALTLEPC